MIRIIDLFAGMGGIRLGVEQACTDLKLAHKCVFTSEIKEYAKQLYINNFKDEIVHGDITKIQSSDIPDFDLLLAGFPCQAFSVAGKRQGFNDIRGTLFFDIQRILKEKKPSMFILENVEGLATHDKGKTINIIISSLKEIGYHTSYKILNSKNFGVPQERKRIYIVGSLDKEIILDNFISKIKSIKNIQEHNLPPYENDFTNKLLELYTPQQLWGKSIKDKRGGVNNIHSWDLELKGKISSEQKEIMSTLMKERRKKKWAEIKGIVWMDGMPLTLDEIYSFYSEINKKDLKKSLDDLVIKKYLRFEYPKDLITINNMSKREYKTTCEKGYNIVTGKLSFTINKILHPNDITNTIVATEADKIGIIDNNKIRILSFREYLRIFGFPESYEIPDNFQKKYFYDLIGNTVTIPVVKQVAIRLFTQQLFNA